MHDTLNKCGAGETGGNTGVRPSSRPPSRIAETARPPRSGARLRSATVLPPPPLSVVERHATERFPCAAVACESEAEVTTRVMAYGMSVVVLLCSQCAGKLSGNSRPVPIAKGSK
jgi:hypothetical protein